MPVDVQTQERCIIIITVNYCQFLPKNAKNIDCYTVSETEKLGPLVLATGSPDFRESPPDFTEQVCRPLVVHASQLPCAKRSSEGPETALKMCACIFCLKHPYVGHCC